MSTKFYFPTNQSFGKRLIEPPPMDDPKDFMNGDAQLARLRREDVSVSVLDASHKAEFSDRFTTEELRLKKIRHSRNFFVGLAVLFAALGVLCAYLQVPYQPFVAFDIAILGIIIVLAMKAAGK